MAKHGKKQLHHQKQQSVPQIEKKDKTISYQLLRLIIFVFAVLLYAQTITYDYTLDDTLMITSNEMTKKGISGIPEIFSNDAFVGFFGKDKDLVAGGRYRPLTHAMFAVEYELFGASPFVGHFMNIILYALLGLIVFNTLTHCFKNITQKREWIKFIPFTATLLFIAHPLHTEVVSNIKGRDEIISMGASMLALLYSLKYIESKHVKYLIFTFLSLLIGLFSKENAITFVALIPLTLYFFTKSNVKDYIKVMIPSIFAAIIFVAARYKALGFLTSNTIQTEILNNPFIHASKAEELATVIYTWLVYVKLLIFPHPLTHDYYPWHIEIMSFSQAWPIIALIVVLGILAVAAFYFKKKHLISYGILFFVITFSIQSNLLFNIGTFMNERFMFVALLGFCLIAAYLITQLSLRRQQSALILFGVLMLLYSIKTISRSTAWKDNYTLFTTDVKISKNSAKCNVSAAESIIDKAEKEKNSLEATNMFQQAYEYLKHAQQLHPTYYGAYDLAGKAAFHLKDYTASYEYYKACLQINPEAPVPVNNIYLVSLAATHKKRYAEAEEMLKWVIDFAPDSLHYSLELANVYDYSGNISKSIQVLENLTETHPTYAKAWAKLGEIYGKHMNDVAKSEYYLLKAWELNPQDFNVNENLGIVFGMQNKFQLSIDYFMNALAIDSTIARLHTNIGNTYAMMGENEKALIHFQKASVLEQQQVSQ